MTPEAFLPPPLSGQRGLLVRRYRVWGRVMAVRITVPGSVVWRLIFVPHPPRSPLRANVRRESDFFFFRWCAAEVFLALTWAPAAKPHNNSRSR